MVVVVEGCPIRRWATLEWMLNKTRKVPSERPEVLEVVGGISAPSMSGFRERVRTFPPRFGVPIEDGNT
jgi:hypothetical protein